MKKNRNRRLTFGLICIFLCIGCVSKPKVEVAEPVPDTTTDGAEPVIDFLRLQDRLGLQKRADDLGYAEKSFNTCQVGSGYSSSSRCQLRTFVLVQYRLQCRESDDLDSGGAISDTQIKDLGDHTIKWTLANQLGTSQTDQSGYGQIRAVFPKSQRKTALKLASGRQFLYVRAGEITRIVAPPKWCASGSD